MIRINPTPELRELLTHHHRTHQSKHIQAKHQLQTKNKTHEILHWSQISSRNPPLRAKSVGCKLNPKTLNLFFVKPNFQLKQHQLSTN
jgi:hypothetical protein